MANKLDGVPEVSDLELDLLEETQKVYAACCLTEGMQKIRLKYECKNEKKT